MNFTKTLLLGAGVVTIGIGAGTGEANANSGFGPQVERVDLSMKDGIHIDVLLKNVSNNKHVNAVNIQPASGTMDLNLDGFVKCAKDKSTDFIGSKAYFGTVSLQNGQIVENGVLFRDDYDPGFTEWEGIGNGQWVNESGNHDPFVVPLAAIKNGHPAVRFDPVAELEKKLQQHLGQGKSKAEFYQKEQMIAVQRPISLSGTCRGAAKSDGPGSQASTGNAVSSGYRTIMANLTIRYEGDPAVNETPVVHAQMANNPNQIGNNFPFKLDKADFQPNIPHYNGKCPPDQNPKIRVNFQTSGSTQGLIDLKVMSENSPYGEYGSYFETSGIVNNPAQGAKHIDFSFPLKEMLAQDKYAFMSQPGGQTQHNMRIKARTKPFQGGEWSEWKDFDTAMYFHGCKPQVNVNVGGIGGKMGFDNGGQGGNDPIIPTLDVRPGINGGPAKPGLNIQQQQPGGDPAPQLQIKKSEENGEAGLILPAVQKVREAGR
ncbi:MAG: hypothetical protein EOM26_12970 [Alphaproteobacteria bacterium]|nr:hypothetical protein [Alphaproteobacteria bacterium]